MVVDVVLVVDVLLPQLTKIMVNTSSMEHRPVINLLFFILLSSFFPDNYYSTMSQDSAVPGFIEPGTAANPSLKVSVNTGRNTDCF